MKWFAFICIIVLNFSVYAHPLRIVTEKLPPLQFKQDNGAITGAMVDVVNLLLKKSNIECEIEMLPWARSYQIALERENTLIFSMLRGEDRENKFIWVGKIFAIDSYLVALKSHDAFSIDSIEDAKLKARKALQDKKIDLAQAYYIKAYGLEPDNVSLLEEMAQMYRGINNDKLVELCFQLILKNDCADDRQYTHKASSLLYVLAVYQLLFSVFPCSVF